MHCRCYSCMTGCVDYMAWSYTAPLLQDQRPAPPRSGASAPQRLRAPALQLLQHGARPAGPTAAATRPRAGFLERATERPPAAGSRTTAEGLLDDPVIDHGSWAFTAAAHLLAVPPAAPRLGPASDRPAVSAVLRTALNPENSESEFSMHENSEQKVS